MEEPATVGSSHYCGPALDVSGLFSTNVVSFSRNVVLRGLLFSLNSVSKPRMLSVRADYVLSSLHVALNLAQIAHAKSGTRILLLKKKQRRAIDPNKHWIWEEDWVRTGPDGQPVSL